MNDNFEIVPVIEPTLFDHDWVRDEHPPGTTDPNWIRKFADDGGQAFLSGDFQILQHWPDLIAYIGSGLIAFFPPPGFDRLKGYGQASLIIRWPGIVEKTKVSQRGECWRVPMLWTPDVTKFEKLEDPRRPSINSAPWPVNLSSNASLKPPANLVATKTWHTSMRY
jgi:hypothetical protein